MPDIRTGRRRIRLSGDGAGLDRVFAELARFTADHHVPDRVRRELHVALDEVLTNIVKYGARGRRAPALSVGFELKGGMLEVVISDDAPAFDPLAAADPKSIHQDVAERPIGGLGIYLVKRLMDEVAYTRTRGRNRLVLRKAIGRRAPSGPARASSGRSQTTRPTRRRRPKS